MTDLLINSIFVSLVCFVLGAAIAWLLAAALYPTRKDALAARERHDGASRRAEVRGRR